MLYASVSRGFKGGGWSLSSSSATAAAIPLTRAALTGLKKKGHAITSDKVEGSTRVYRVAAG